MFEYVLSMFGDGLNKVRKCRYSCVNIKNDPKNGTDNGYCGSGFILHTNTFKPLREKLNKTFKQQLEKAWFYTDFKYLIITNLHVVEVGLFHYGPEISSYSASWWQIFEQLYAQWR